MLVVRHHDKPGVLAHVFERLRDANLNVQETENIIFDGAHAAVARINLDGEPPATVARVHSTGNADILNLAAREAGLTGTSNDYDRSSHPQFLRRSRRSLPVSVLEEAQRDLVSLPGVGMSVLEISHRSKTFEDILATTEADLRKLGNVPATHKVLFLQGGASTAVLDGADEPAHGRQDRRLHRHGRMGAEGRERSAARRQR